MKTARLKILLLTVALGCGLLPSRPAVAQLTGDFYTKNILPGFNLVANQLDASPDNTLNSVLPYVPDGSQVYKWNPEAGQFHIDTYDALFGWGDAATGDPSAMTLGPREAAFLFNPGGGTGKRGSPVKTSV